MDFTGLTDEELNALHRAVMDEWIKRNTPTDEDLERMAAEAAESRDFTDELEEHFSDQIEEA